MGVARKWDFSTSGGAVNLGGVSGDLSEHRGSGNTLLGITSLFMHKLTGLEIKNGITFLARYIYINSRADKLIDSAFFDKSTKIGTEVV